MDVTSGAPCHSLTWGTMRSDWEEPSSTAASALRGTASNSSLMQGRTSTRSAITRGYSGANALSTVAVESGSSESCRHDFFFASASVAAIAGGVRTAATTAAVTLAPDAIPQSSRRDAARIFLP